MLGLAGKMMWFERFEALAPIQGASAIVARLDPPGTLLYDNLAILTDEVPR